MMRRCYAITPLPPRHACLRASAFHLFRVYFRYAQAIDAAAP